MIDLPAEIERLLSIEVMHSERLSGGDLSTVYRVRLANGRDIVAKLGRDVTIEAEMLTVIARTGAAAPQVLAVHGDLMLLEMLEVDGTLTGNAWTDLAAHLDRLHRTTGPDYGWDCDYAFGDLVIPNRRAAHWPTFWAEHRLCVHLAYLETGLARRIERLAGDLEARLPAAPSPALLHGDLWGGNILVRGGHISGLIDPAAYHGDREVDIAMLGLFDRPPPAFLDRLALDPDWQQRAPIYRLWPLLVHLRLFGGSYEIAVASELTALGA